MAARESDRWLVKPGATVDLAALDTRTTDGAPGAKATTKDALPALTERLAALQERLWAEGEQALLIVLQAMDCGGKDGAIEHVFSGINPQGVRIANFKVPTDEELAHDFLWRIHRVVPRKGEIGLFNRSHYEDVLVVRVKGLAPERVWRRRFDQINEFEELLAESGTRIVKVWIHISKEEQAERLQARLADPEKRWKFRVGDLEERKRWDEYMDAYREAVERTSTAAAPWYIVPSDRKWYRNWAISNIALETLEDMDPQFPPPEDDLDAVVIEQSRAAALAYVDRYLLPLHST
ncbi:MAG: polyphosphate kinase 2 family protein [Acidimicrobiales bacterium]